MCSVASLSPTFASPLAAWADTRRTRPPPAARRMSKRAVAVAPPARSPSSQTGVVCPVQPVATRRRALDERLKVNSTLRAAAALRFVTTAVSVSIWPTRAAVVLARRPATRSGTATPPEGGGGGGGAVAVTFHVQLAGVGSALPAGSVARTSKV